MSDPVACPCGAMFWHPEALANHRKGCMAYTPAKPKPAVPVPTASQPNSDDDYSYLTGCNDD